VRVCVCVRAHVLTGEKYSDDTQKQFQVGHSSILSLGFKSPCLYSGAQGLKAQTRVHTSTTAVMT